MIKRTALFIAIVLITTAGRLLACEWSCGDAAVAHHAAACHQKTAAATTVANVDLHQCEHAGRTPAVTAQKTRLLQQPTASIATPLQRLPLVMIAASAGSVVLRPSMTRAVQPPHPLVLRI